MDLSNRRDQIAAAMIIIAIVALIFVTKKFLTTILLSVFFAYLLVPLYSYLLRMTKKKRISSLFSISVVFLIFLIFAFGVISSLESEVSNLAQSEDFLHTTTSDFFNNTIAFVEGLSPDLASYFTVQIKPLREAPVGWMLPKILPYLTNALSALASNMPIYFAQFAVAILLTYYLLIDGLDVFKKTMSLLPEKEQVSRFTDELIPIYNSLFKVYFITSVVTGIIAMTGFLVMGIPYPFLWGSLTAVVSLIPLIGAHSVYLLISLYYLLIHDYTKCAAIFVFGLLFLSVIPENIIRPHLASRSASIHPAITLLAFAAPIFVIGAIGVIIGPALYGFVLAAYRTKMDYLEAEIETSNDLKKSLASEDKVEMKDLGD
jgi:predicted PurR-regulated permease PerM